MKTIPLTKGYVAWVDDEDYALVAGFSWYAAVGGPAACYARADTFAGGRRKSFAMHSLIMAPPPGFEVDHVEHHPASRIVDNRKSNLRIATRRENIRNNRKVTGCSSVFKGVSRGIGPHPSSRTWKACLGVEGRKQKWLGRFACETEAALAYDRAALEHFGDFARTNFLGPHAIYASLPLSPNPDNSPPLLALAELAARDGR